MTVRVWLAEEYRYEEAAVTHYVPDGRPLDRSIDGYRAWCGRKVLHTSRVEAPVGSICAACASLSMGRLSDG